MIDFILSLDFIVYAGFALLLMSLGATIFFIAKRNEGGRDDFTKVYDDELNAIRKRDRVKKG